MSSECDKKSPPTFQFYASDFVGGTMGFTAEQTGAYILLLCYEWFEGSIPSDDAECCAIGKCSSAAIGLVKRKFSIVLPNGRLQNPKLESVRAKQNEYRQKQAESGRKGGLKRKQPSTEPKAPPKQALSDTQALHSPSPSTERESGGGVVGETEPPFPEVPPMTRAAYDELVKMRGMTPEFGDWFWNTHDARDWKDGRGVQITKLEPALLNAWKSWRGNMSSGGGEKPEAASSPAKPAGPRKFMGRWDVDHEPQRSECADDSQYESFSQMFKYFFDKELKAKRNGGSK